MKGICIMGEMRKDREGEVPNDVDGLIDHYRLEVRKGQEAYDELMKEVHMLRGTKQIVERLSADLSKMKSLKSEVEALKQQLHVDGEKYKKENNDLYNRIADALEVNESHQKLNGKLQERLTELEEENKKRHEHLNKQVENARKSGL